ncbi:MAG: porin [Planctomycetota bacterium]|nr:porin [Planctomycetota bacterium]
MIRCVIAVLAACVLCFGSVAHADDLTSSRDIQSAVDSYLASSENDANLVGGPGSAGYDAGFWIRGGDFMLRINATLQARFEANDWDNEDDAQNAFNQFFQGQQFAGDTSGFSLPRATIKLSGEAPCDICYYIELEFGHFGRDVRERGGTLLFDSANVFGLGGAPTILGTSPQSYNYDNTREAWIEWCSCEAFNFRMGQIKTPTTRQMMVAPELQQFVDVSFASAYTGLWMPGYTDRNRDHGFMVHGAFGCDGEWSYMVAVTNGDGGDSIRNVLDHRTSDNLAFSARLNWAFAQPIGYEEGALRQQTCGWYGEVGLWAHYYADRSDKPHQSLGDVLNAGIDLALGYGGFSFTGAFSLHEASDADAGPLAADDFKAFSWLAQLGYHFPGTAWEIAARASFYENDEFVTTDGEVLEFAFGVNYYLNGHANKLQLDVSFLEASEGAVGIWSPYPGYLPLLGNENSQILIRFQWQLAL